jgi:hypothetical protein
VARPRREPKLHLFGQLKRITKQWLDTCLVCKGGTYPAQLMYQELADMACERITAAITRARRANAPDQGAARPYNPTGSTAHVNFNTSKTDRWQTDPAVPRQLGDPRQRLGGRVLPRGRSHPRVRAYVKNHNLGSKCRTATARRPQPTSPTSSCWWTTATATTTCSPDRRDQGLPPRGRQGEEVHHGNLLGARREQPRHYGRWAFAEAYERRNRDLDPQLVWRGKDEQDWSDLVVHAPPLYIQEKVHPKVLIDDLLVWRGKRAAEVQAPKAKHPRC